MKDGKTARIRELNDAFRRSFCGGRLVVTAGVAELAEEDLKAVLEQVQAFSDFSTDVDPHREHDFGALSHLGTAYFWKIDYYDADCVYGSEDPASPEVTTRVLTVMRADEY